MNTFRNLILLAVFFFAISYDSHTLGVDHDTRHRLYPEIDFDSCVVSEIYGMRWRRLGSVTFILGISFLLSSHIYKKNLRPAVENIIKPNL